LAVSLASDRVCAGAMVTRLALTDFRGYGAARLTLEPRPVVLTGPNGAGKTNLLEAVSFLAPGRGLRRARLGEVDRRVPPARATALPPGAWACAATIAGPRGATEIGTGRDAASPGERRLVQIDGTAARTQAALAAHLCVIWLTPQMDRLFTEAASARRRFLDRLVYGFDPAHAHRVGAYEQAMRDRARLLADDRPADPAWLGALEGRMAEHGVAVAAARRDTVARLDEACAETRGAFPAARLALDGEIETWLETLPALGAEEEFARRLAAARRADAAAGTTALGPHRADLAVRHGGTHMSASQCSTGEQKALLIGIVLAFARLLAARRGEVPILLLDEVAAHLDALRRDALFEAIAAARGQAWLTGTDRGLFDGMEGVAQFLTVADAVISR
jgi:DNA replication and repair protein RecF